MLVEHSPRRYIGAKRPSPPAGPPAPPREHPRTGKGTPSAVCPQTAPATVNWNRPSSPKLRAGSSRGFSAEIPVPGTPPRATIPARVVLRHQASFLPTPECNGGARRSAFPQLRNQIVALDAVIPKCPEPTDRERTDDRSTHSHKHKATRQDGETRGESTMGLQYTHYTPTAQGGHRPPP